MNTTNRIWQVLKLNLLINKKGLTALVGGLTFGYFIVLFLMNVMGEATVYGSAPSALAMMLLTIVSSGVTMFSGLKTKQQRAAFFMIPASEGEKFMSRLLITTVGVTLMVAVALVLADGLRWIAHILLRRGGDGFVVGPTLALIGTTSWRDATVAVLLVIWAQSVYILGSAFFRRHPWFFTTATMFVVTMLVCGAVTYGAYELHDRIDLTEYEVNETALFFWSAGVLAALTLVNYWLSYRIFRRMQVINNKWLNL